MAYRKIDLPSLAQVQPAQVVDLKAYDPQPLQESQQQEVPLADFARQLPDTDPRSSADPKQILKTAADEAQQILQRAEEMAQVIQQQARTSGHAEGLRLGREEAWAEAADLIRFGETLAAQAMAERQKMRQQFEADTVHLALSIAKRIVAAELAATPEIVIESCREAMEYAFQRQTMRVHVHPSDMEMLNADKESLAALAGIEHLEFVPDYDLQPGDLIVKTPAGEIDARIASKAEVIEHGLFDLISQRQAIEASRLRALGDED